MGMFGELKDFPVTDLLPALAGRSGVLTVVNQDFEAKLWLTGGSIVHLEASNLPPNDTWAARQQLYRILNSAHEGCFNFDNRTPPTIPRSVQWPIEWVLLTAVSQSDILAEYGDMLPEPNTVFQVTGQDPADLNHDLRLRLQNIAPLLDGTKSARLVAHTLGAEEIDILYTLARLRILGFVRPVRRFVERPVTATPSVPLIQAMRPPALLQRLAGFLRLKHA